MNYEVIQINEQTWRIEDGGVRFFLLVGTEKALLIDSGMMVKNAKEIAEELTDLPIELLNTHADRDHVAGNEAFETFYMHPAECSNYYKGAGKTGTATPIWDGDVIDLGDRPLEIISIPGHTPGSIAVLDKKYRALISGDPIQDGRIFMFGVQREIHAYQHSLIKLGKYEGQFDEIYPSHGTFPVYPEIIQQLYDGVNEMLEGKIEPEETTMHGTPIKEYKIGVASILSDIDFYTK